MSTASQQKKGFALLLALIVSSVVLAIGVSILNISVNQINLSSTARESELAFQSAHAGIDCVWYWRYEEAAAYTAEEGAMPSIECFGGSPYGTPSSSALPTQSPTDGHARRFLHTFEWGDPLRCTEVDMYVLNASGDDPVIVSFTNQGIGEDGIKTCNSGNVCTVLVSSGYNRPCDELASSIFSVQREITVEF